MNVACNASELFLGGQLLRQTREWRGEVKEPPLRVCLVLQGSKTLHANILVMVGLIVAGMFMGRLASGRAGYRSLHPVSI